MPVLDGPAAARLLRGRLGFGGLIAGVTSCSQATSGDLVEAGADCVLQKGSISIDTLRRVLGPAVAAATTPTAPAAAPQAAPTAGVDGGAKGVCPPAVGRAASALAGPLVAAKPQPQVGQPAAPAMPTPSSSAAGGPQAQLESDKIGGSSHGSRLGTAGTVVAGADTPGPSGCPECPAPPFPTLPARFVPHPSASPAETVGVRGSAAAAVSGEDAALTSKSPVGDDSPSTSHPTLSGGDSASKGSLAPPPPAVKTAFVPPPHPIPVRPCELETAPGPALVGSPSSPRSCDSCDGALTSPAALLPPEAPREARGAAIAVT